MNGNIVIVGDFNIFFLFFFFIGTILFSKFSKTIENMIINNKENKYKR